MKLCLAGFGRMNYEVFACARQRPEFNVVSVLRLHPVDLEGVPVTNNAEKAFSGCEVVIDFSTPEACIANSAKAATMGKAVVIGTTGLGAEGLERLRKAVASGGASGVVSQNFSVGASVFIGAAKFLQRKLAGYDSEMVEVHHRTKKDAPSGTALRTLAALGKSLQELPVHSLRVGDVVGEHSLVFAGNSERLELSHKATSRKCFAEGALLAAKWVAGRKDGVLHDFSEMLGS